MRGQLLLLCQWRSKISPWWNTQEPSLGKCCSHGHGHCCYFMNARCPPDLPLAQKWCRCANPTLFQHQETDGGLEWQRYVRERGEGLRALLGSWDKIQAQPRASTASFWAVHSERWGVHRQRWGCGKWRMVLGWSTERWVPRSPTHLEKGTLCLAQAWIQALGESAVLGAWKSPSNSLGIDWKQPGNLLMANPISPVPCCWQRRAGEPEEITWSLEDTYSRCLYQPTSDACTAHTLERWHFCAWVASAVL